MRARQADHVVVVTHQVAPRLGALHHRDAQLVRADDLGVVVVHRRGAHDQRRARNVFRLVFINNLCAQRLKARGDIGFQPVRAGNRHAKAEQKLAERAHRNAADADQMDSFLIFNIGLDRQGHDSPKPPQTFFGGLPRPAEQITQRLAPLYCYFHQTRYIIVQSCANRKRKLEFVQTLLHFAVSGHARLRPKKQTAAKAAVFMMQNTPPARARARGTPPRPGSPAAGGRRSGGRSRRRARARRASAA